MAYYFVDDKFDEKINGKKRGDISLTFNTNAFNSMAAAYSSAVEWNKTDKDGNLVNELVFLDKEITSRVLFPAGKVSILSDENGKLTGSLKITADVSGGDASEVVFSNFNRVELAGANADTFAAGSKKTAKTYDKMLSAGTIKVGANSKVTTISGYKTVNIAGDNAIVGKVESENYTVNYKKDIPVSSRNRTNGSVTVKDDAAVLKDILGYSKVTLDDARVDGNIIGVVNDQLYTAIYTDGVFTGYKFETKPGSFVWVSVTDNVKWGETSVSGTLTVKQIAGDDGSVKVNDSTVGGSINNYKKVTVTDDSMVNGISRFDQITETDKKSCKTNKKGVATLTETCTVTQSFNGSLTIDESMIGAEKNDEFTAADAVGYSTVRMTNSSAGDIKAMNNVKDAWNISEKTVYQSADANVFKKENWQTDSAVQVISYDYTGKKAAAGSVTIKLDKDAESSKNYYCSSILGYKSVAVSGFNNKKDEDKDIKFAVNGCIYKESDVTETVKDTRVIGTIGSDGNSKTSLNGKLMRKDTESANGSVKLADAIVTGVIGGYKNVTIKDSMVWGGRDLPYGFQASVNKKSESTGVYTTAEDGKISLELTEKQSNKSAGTFKAENSIVYMPLKGFSKVTLTNTTVGHNIEHVGNYSSSGKYSFSWNDYAEYTANKIETSEDSENWDSYKKDIVNKSTGSVTIKLDKNFDKDVDYIYGQIIGYKNVSISGYNEGDAVKKVTVTSITGSDMTFTEEFKNNVTFGTLETVSVGKLTLNDVTVTDGVTGYANVSLKNSSVYGALVGGNETMQKLGSDRDYKVVEQQVVGSLTLENSYFGSSSGFKSVKVKSGLNSAELYLGTSNCKETFTVAENAVLVIDNLVLQSEDKLTVNGELVIHDGIGDDGWGCALSSIGGKGVVYGNNIVMQQISGVIANSRVTGVNLGQTSEYFRGAVLEVIDYSAETANIWEDVDSAYDGWLGNASGFSGLDFQDQTDCIRFTAEEDETVYISSNEWDNASVIGDTVKLMDKDGRVIEEGEIFQYENYLGQKTWRCTFDVAAGEEYVLCITRNDANSMSYRIGMSEPPIEFKN